MTYGSLVDYLHATFLWRTGCTPDNFELTTAARQCSRDLELVRGFCEAHGLDFTQIKQRLRQAAVACDCECLASVKRLPVYHHLPRQTQLQRSA